jgi:hypothetical protein
MISTNRNWKNGIERIKMTILKADVNLAVVLFFQVLILILVYVEHLIFHIKIQKQMKLYTEEQVRKAMMMASSVITDDEVIAQLTPIELPSDKEIWKWWQTEKFQKERGEQEYTMLYEIDLPKIIKSFIEHFSKTYGGK